MVDFAFLKLFATPQNKLVLIAFLNAILTLEDKIVDLKVLNPFNLKDCEDDKLTILDIKATDSRGRIFNIEMQLSLHAAFVKRIVYYASELYVDQMRSGDDYVTLNPVYAISIIDDVLWQNSTKVHHRFQLADRDSARILEDTIEIHTLELGLYNVQESELAGASAADRW